MPRLVSWVGYHYAPFWFKENLCGDHPIKDPIPRGQELEAKNVNSKPWIKEVADPSIRTRRSCYVMIVLSPMQEAVADQPPNLRGAAKLLGRAQFASSGSLTDLSQECSRRPTVSIAVVFRPNMESYTLVGFTKDDMKPSMSTGSSS
ncbi:hypothetical protein VNO77_19212 [Canavalia gladiata]|uniref:Uncharacterized protein n=1 Tax=Canavalia gladiata TaxID=3824 RepID=A0AAN9LQY0_CANGL